jgi:predicted nucleic acid-binding protein
MLAIDTNVIVRYLTRDDPKQADAARSLIDGTIVFVCTTVLLETAWVLRKVYGLQDQAVVRALRGFSGLPTVRLEHRESMAKALAWVEGGMDFADALHLARAEGCSAFLTFDRRLVGLGAALSGLDVRTP